MKVLEIFDLIDGPVMTDLSRQAVLAGKSLAGGIAVDNACLEWLYQDGYIDDSYFFEKYEKHKPEVIIMKTPDIFNKLLVRASYEYSMIPEEEGGFYQVSIPYLVDDPSCTTCSNIIRVASNDTELLNKIVELYKEIREDFVLDYKTLLEKYNLFKGETVTFVDPYKR